MIPSPRAFRIALVVALIGAGALLVGKPADVGLQEAAETITAALHAAGVMVDVRYGHVEAAANVLLFVPLGFLLTGATRSWWIGAVGGFALSAGAESLQFALLSSRQGTLRDLVCNTLGAVIGASAASFLIAASRRRTSTPTAGASRSADPL